MAAHGANLRDMLHDHFDWRNLIANHFYKIKTARRAVRKNYGKNIYNSASSSMEDEEDDESDDDDGSDTTAGSNNSGQSDGGNDDGSGSCGDDDGDIDSQ